jgi:hypothetical protein
MGAWKGLRWIWSFEAYDEVDQRCRGGGAVRAAAGDVDGGKLVLSAAGWNISGTSCGRGSLGVDMHVC